MDRGCEERSAVFVLGLENQAQMCTLRRHRFCTHLSPINVPLLYTSLSCTHPSTVYIPFLCTSFYCLHSFIPLLYTSLHVPLLYVHISQNSERRREKGGGKTPVRALHAEPAKSRPSPSRVGDKKELRGCAILR